nr:MAG TPA_asm: hypothetical protein [Bacteriophage sp.]
MVTLRCPNLAFSLLFLSFIFSSHLPKTPICQ